MSNKVKDLISIEHFDLNNIEIDKKSHKFYFLYWICDDQKRPKKLYCKFFVP